MPLMSFNMFLEMARRGKGEMEGEAPRIPLNFDKDDLEFLEQFPSNYWESAMSLRYHKLHDALIKLHEIRMDIIKKEFPHALDPKSPGHDDAFEEVKKRTENLKDLGLDEEEEFNFKAMARVEKKGLKRYRSKKDYKVKAKPYLNRLYHRLERTRGEPHLPESESENTGIGQYGYDLSYPKTITHGEKSKPKKISRGMNWVGDEQWERDLKNYFQHASHGHFGTHNKVRDQLLGEDHGIMWMSVGLDDPTYDWALESIEENKKAAYVANKKVAIAKHLEDVELAKAEGRPAPAPTHGYSDEEETEEETEETGKRNRSDFIPAEVKKKFEEEARKEVNEKVRRGELFAPKVPGPVLLDNGTIKEEGLSKEERMFQIKGEKIIKPNIYLPHEKKIINGEEKWNPLVKPSTYLKKINSDHPQYEELSKSLRKKWHGETRPSELPIWTKHEIIDKDTGKPNPSTLEFGSTKGIKRIGPQFNHNTMAQTRTGSVEKDKEIRDKHLRQSKFVIQGKKRARAIPVPENNTDPGRDKMVTFDGVKEFIEGIKDTIEGGKSGGASSAVRDLAREQIQDIHQIVYMMAERTLDADQLKTPKGRRLFAKNKTSNILQRISRYGLGGEDLGTRRRPNTKTGSLTDTEGGNVDVSSAGERPTAGIKYRHVPASLWDKHEMLAAAVSSELENIKQSVKMSQMGDPLDKIFYSEEKEKEERKFYGDIKEKLKNAGKTDEEIYAQILSWIQEKVPKIIITAQVNKMSSTPRIGAVPTPSIGATPAPQVATPKPPDVSRPAALKAPIIGGGLAAYRQRQQEAPGEETPKLDWNILSFKSIFEKVEYLKNKLRG